MKKEYTSEDIKNILENVVLYTQFYITKNGKICVPEAEELINWLNSFTKYCFPFKYDDWEKNIRKLVYEEPEIPRPGVKITKELQDYLDNDKESIIQALYHYIDAAEIMDIYAKTKSWEKVTKTLKNQGHSGYTFSCLKDILLDYSLIGVEFINRFDPNLINRDKERKKVYLERKSYLEQLENNIKVLNDECNQSSNEDNNNKKRKKKIKE